MSFVHVNLIVGKDRYTVDIDPALGVESVKSQLVHEPKKEEDGKNYSLHLVDSFALSNGDEIQLVETMVEGVRGLKKQADGT
jgi:hypothetical protein